MKIFVPAAFVALVSAVVVLGAPTSDDSAIEHVEFFRRNEERKRHHHGFVYVARRNYEPKPKPRDGLKPHGPKPHGSPPHVARKDEEPEPQPHSDVPKPNIPKPEPVHKVTEASLTPGCDWHS